MKEVIISIKEIIDISEDLERAFFNWMREEKIWWGRDIINVNYNIINVNYITIQEKDLERVKEKFGEIRIVK